MYIEERFRGGLSCLKFELHFFIRGGEFCKIGGSF